MAVRLEGLPPASALHDWWGIREELGAVLAELLDALTRAIARVFGARKSRLGEPLRIPRPEPPNAKPKKSAASRYLDIARGLMGR